MGRGSRKLNIRLRGQENSNFLGAWPVYQIISMVEWIRHSRLSIKNFLSGLGFGFSCRVYSFVHGNGSRILKSNAQGGGLEEVFKVNPQP